MADDAPDAPPTSRPQALETVLGELESLLAASPVGIAFLDHELRYRRINAALAALNGLPIDAHLGRSIAEVLPDAAPMLEPMLRGVMARGEPLRDVELAMPGPDGHVLLANFFPVRGSAGAIFGVGGVVLDVTARHHAEAALRREQQRVRSILEHTPASIWVKDLEGRVLLANQRLADALGVPFERLLGTTSDQVLPPDAAAEHRAHDLVVAREQRALEVEERVPGPDGDKTFLSIKFPIPGDPPMVGGIATDITQRKQMEDELRRALWARDNVLALVSHDLRNPLGAIELSASMIGDQVRDARAQRHLEVIRRSCTRMKHLIDDLLDTASIAAGRLSVALRTEPAGDVAREAFELHRVLADEQGIRLEYACDVGDAAIACDRDRVMQVFANLLSNALKFCRAGDTIRIECALADGYVRYAVSDTGPGIPPAQLAHLFDPYWSGTEGKRGAGLGLYIARGVVERHGGRLTVESVVGAGARFAFTLPIA